MRFLQIQDPMIHFKPVYLCSVICFALLVLPCEGVPVDSPQYRPKGLVGDGRKDGAGSHTQHQTNSSASLSVLIATIVLGPFLAMNFVRNIDGIEDRVEMQRRDNFEQNGGTLLRKKLSRKNPELAIYNSEEMDSIANRFRDEILAFTCNRGVKFHHGTLPNTPSGSKYIVQVVVATIQRVPKSKIEHFVDQLMFLAKPHRNLVRILGCCLDKRSPVVVYEHYGKGETTLYNFTHGANPNKGFSREMRLKAAAGIARGLADFNSYKLPGPPVLHRNICSANIMMDDGSYHPKVFYTAGSNLITEGAISSPDVYRDPGFPNNWSDVYSFGVVLVELLTGNDRSMMENSIKMAQDKRLLEIIDEGMVGKGKVARGVSKEVAALAERCLNVKPSKRPTMKKVAEELASLMKRA